MMTLEMNPVGNDCRNYHRGRTPSRNLVLVASGPPCSRERPSPGGRGVLSRSQESAAGPSGLYCTRLAAHTVYESATWHRRLSKANGVSPRFAEPVGLPPCGRNDPPRDASDLRALLEQALVPGKKRDSITETIDALQEADAVIAGPLSPEDANAPNLLPHLADLAAGAFRALRPPRELLIHPAFAQIARRFPFIQMSHHEARALGSGAIDIQILAERLRRLQGDPGEFAITAFGGVGLLWADHSWWEIEPIGNVDESAAGAVFCMAWTVARRFRHSGAEQALAYARAATAAALRTVTVGPGRHFTG